MTTAAKIAFGAELWLGASAGSVVKVAELLTVDPPQMTRGTVDATTHDSPAGAMQYIAEGVFDPGQIKATMNYIAGSAGDLALVSALTTGTIQYYKIVVKSAAGKEDLTGQAIVTDYGPTSMGVKGKQEASVSLQVTGAETETAEP